MNFAEIVGEVIGITARPDKATEIASSVNAVLQRCILKANFARDLVETSIPISASLYGDTIDISTLLTRFRKIKYIKPRARRYYLIAADAEHILTPGGVIQPNRFFIAGLNLTYTLSELNTYLDIGYYQHAPVLSGTDTHWFLDVAPHAIVDLAVARLFRSIGDDTSARNFEVSGTDLYNIAKRDFEDSVLAQAR